MAALAPGVNQQNSSSSFAEERAAQALRALYAGGGHDRAAAQSHCAHVPGLAGDVAAWQQQQIASPHAACAAPMPAFAGMSHPATGRDTSTIYAGCMQPSMLGLTHPTMLSQMSAAAASGAAQVRPAHIAQDVIQQNVGVAGGHMQP